MIIGIGALLMASILFGNGGFRSLVFQWREKGRLTRSLVRLRADHESLKQEWTRLQQDPAYTEYLIRKNLGYAKKGEYEYRFVKPEGQGRR